MVANVKRFWGTDKSYERTLNWRTRIVIPKLAFDPLSLYLPVSTQNRILMRELWKGTRLGRCHPCKSGTDVDSSRCSISSVSPDKPLLRGNLLISFFFVMPQRKHTVAVHILQEGKSSFSLSKPG